LTILKNKLLKIKIPIKCPICSNSKLRNKPHKLSINKSKRIFELLHMDLVGPVPKLLYGNYYFFTILDDYSRYGWVLFLKNKIDTFSSFLLWFNRIKNQFST